MNNNDNCEFVYKIEKQIRETEDEFIYTAIYPFSETIVEKKLSKKELEKILRKGMQKSIPLDGVKQAREEIDDLYRYYDNDYFSGNTDSMFCNEVLEILDKLIAESEGKE